MAKSFQKRYLEKMKDFEGWQMPPILKAAQDEAYRRKAWRDADSSMVPEYVAPTRNFRRGTRDRINRDFNRLWKNSKRA